MYLSCLASINEDLDTHKTQLSTQPIKERTSEAAMVDFAPMVHLGCDTGGFYGDNTIFAHLSGHVYSTVYQ